MPKIRTAQATPIVESTIPLIENVVTRINPNISIPTSSSSNPEITNIQQSLKLNLDEVHNTIKIVQSRQITIRPTQNLKVLNNRIKINRKQTDPTEDTLNLLATPRIPKPTEPVQIIPIPERSDLPKVSKLKKPYWQLPQEEDGTYNYSEINFETHIILESLEGYKFRLSRKAIEQSKVLTNIFKDNDTHTQENSIVPFTHINGETMQYIIEFLEYHVKKAALPIPKNPEQKKKIKFEENSFVSQWDYEFINETILEGKKIEKKYNEQLLQRLRLLTIASTIHLNIKSLKNIACYKWACIINSFDAKTELDTIRKYLGVENDLTEEDIKTIQEENEWIEKNIKKNNN